MRKRAISIQGFTLEAIDFRVVFLPLLFKVFELFLEGGVAASFNDLRAGCGLADLSLKGLT